MSHSFKALPALFALSLLALVVQIAPSHAQISFGGTPLGLTRGADLLRPARTVELPPVDREALLAEDEAASVRDEVLQSVDFSKLIKLSYGNGGGRQVILWSAVDCPSCYRFEEWMMRSNPDATFYLVPTALDRTNKSLRNLVTNIWCSLDPATAWRSWMSGRKQPAGPFKAQCDVSFDTGEAFAMAMTNTGFRLMGTPAYIMENGEVRYRWTNDRVPGDMNVYRKQISDRRLSGFRAAEMQTGFRAIIK